MKKIGIDKAEVDATKILEDNEEFLVVPAVIAREGVFPYPEGKAFKPADELAEAAFTAEGAWVVPEKHPDTLILTRPDDIVGKVENSRFCSKVNGIIANLRFFKNRANPQFLADIKAARRKDVSIGFFYDFDGTPGDFNGEHYDFVQRNILINHVAAGVPLGRCRSPYCGIAVDSFIRKISLDPEETEDYIHIPVEDSGKFVPSSFRTIDISEGIQAVIGKYKSDPHGSTHVQKYLFDKSKDWTMEKAKAWVAEHKKAADSAVNMTLEQIKEKLVQLGKRRDAIMDLLYPKTTLSEEQQEELRGELIVLDAEVKAFEKALQDKVIGAADQEEEGELEKRRATAKARCGKYPISFKEGIGNLTKPAEYENISEDDFADPCNFKYPMVPEDRLRNAWQRLHQEENRAKGGYSEAEWSWMRNRVKKRMEAKGIEVEADALREVERSRRLLPHFELQS